MITRASEGIRLTRRGFLQAGSIGLAGLSLPALLRASHERSGAARSGSARSGAARSGTAGTTRARSCILVFMDGGPAHQDLWDMKPEAPAEYRGEFQAISSSLPGLPVCEHLPLLARQMHRVALVRSVHHAVVDHSAGAYYTLTGRSPVRGGGLIVDDAPDNFPPFGAVLSQWKPIERALPPFVQIPDVQAFDLLNSRAAQQAFDLSREPSAVRQSYGLPDRERRSVEARKFGGLSHLGQCMLLARRLIEAGVRLVTVCCGRRFDQAWDTHRDHFPLLKQSLLPYFDRAFATLLQDLAERSMLDETLVVAMGEFGRTPRLGQITSNAGADQAGRDHWPHCYTVLLAGGGVPPGALYGASDRLAAYPARDPVSPEDIAATLYLLLGVDPETRIQDPHHRPHSVALGTPLVPLVG